MELVQYDQGLSFTKSKYSMYIDSILSGLHNRLKSQDDSSTDTLSHILKILATHGWEKTDDSSFGYELISWSYRDIVVILWSCCVIAVSNKNNTWLYAGEQQLQCKSAMVVAQIPVAGNIDGNYIIRFPHTNINDGIGI